MASSNKRTAAIRLQETIGSLSDVNLAHFSRLCSVLLEKSFVFGQLDGDKADYYKITEFRTLFADYFCLMDLTLVHDDQYRIYYLKSDLGRNNLRFNKLDTVILLSLRLLYWQLSKESENSIIATSVAELAEAIEKTHIYPVLKSTMLEDSLRRLRRHKIVGFSSQSFTMETMVQIYPTILYLVGDQSMGQLESMLRAYQRGGDEDEADED